MLKKQGVLLIIVIIAIFAFLHLGFPSEQHEPRTTGTVMLGGIAFILMTVAVVLSTRLGIIEDLFGGLDRVYQVHRIAGVFAALTALIHFFGVPDVLPEGIDAAANPLAPSGPLGMIALILLVVGLFISLNRKISYSRWRPTHKVMGLLYIVTIGHFMTAPPIFYERFGASGIMLFILALIGIVALVYSLFGMNRRTAVPFVIEEINRLERSIEMVLKPVDAMIDFKPGQFAFVEVQGKEWNEPHPFTISSAPGEDRLRFTIKVLGDWTRKVREHLEVGQDVLVRGPYGRFDSNEAGPKQVWIAGGIGLTPFLSKFRDMDKDDTRNVHFFYATRGDADALFAEEVKSYVNGKGDCKMTSLYSDNGEFARVDVIKEKLPESLDQYEYFMCGPKPMTDGIMKALKKAGVARGKIHTEVFEFR